MMAAYLPYVACILPCCMWNSLHLNFSGTYRNGLGVPSWDQMLADIMQSKAKTGVCANMCYVIVAGENHLLEKGETFIHRSTDPCLQYICEVSVTMKLPICMHVTLCNSHSCWACMILASCIFSSHLVWKSIVSNAQQKWSAIMEHLWDILTNAANSVVSYFGWHIIINIKHMCIAH